MRLPEAISSNFVGAILTGGQSRRMGSPKAALLLDDGRPIVHHLLDALHPLCSHLVLLGSAHGVSLAEYPHVQILPDLTQGQGPLGGLERLFTAYPKTPSLVVACDQPLLTSAVLQRLANFYHPQMDIAAFCADEAFWPFPGVYHPRLAPIVRQQLSQQKRSLKALFQRTMAHYCELPAEQADAMANINTPVERDAALALWVRQNARDLGSIVKPTQTHLRTL